MAKVTPGTDQLLTGWGRTAPSRSQVLGPLELEQLQHLIISRPDGGVLARGAGRSYGDAAQNAGGYVLAPVSKPVIEIDAESAMVRASASVTFTELLSALVPCGLLPPVLPGTRHLTVGGAVAADVHGKNQHGDGSMAGWIAEIELLDGCGELHWLTPDGDRAAFLATVGGMGLTGIILAITLRLRPIRSTLLQVSTRRLPDLDAVLAAMDQTDGRYCVAWIDTTAAGRKLGRGIVDVGDHLAAPDPAAEPDGLAYRLRRPRRAPAMPFCPLGSWSARAFNSLWFRQAPVSRDGLAGLPAFFHRLDAVGEWNRSLGPRGILQYQFAVPDSGYQVLAEVLERVGGGGYAPFLGTLKRFGPASGAPLSFPLPGWSLAIDLPGGHPRLGALLDELDAVVAAAGGRIYLAKDSRMRPGAFNEMYGDLDGWRSVQAKFDPAGVFRSDLGRRIGLC